MLVSLAPPTFLAHSCPNLLPLSSSEVSCHTLQLIGSWLQVSVLLDFVSMRRETTFSFRQGKFGVGLFWWLCAGDGGTFSKTRSTRKPRLDRPHSKSRAHNPCTLAIEQHYLTLWKSRFPMHAISVISAPNGYPISERLAQVPFVVTARSGRRPCIVKLSAFLHPISFFTHPRHHT